MKLSVGYPTDVRRECAFESAVKNKEEAKMLTHQARLWSGVLTAHLSPSLC